jgi:SAM-dependent methyltransferase
MNLNRQFYDEHGRDFSQTRERLQPGVRHLLEALHDDETILDLGCGNGELARSLSRGGHRGAYIGLDFSPSLLKEAGREAFAFPVTFNQVDLAELSQVADHYSLIPNHYSLVTAFAVLHHIPTFELRLKLIREIHDLLSSGGHFMHSNWQFLSSPRLKSRIQPWSMLDLTAQDVDANDYLLDWKRGGKGLRYVHHFDEAELAELARAGQFDILETFYSDGENKRLGLYQIWRKL